MRRSGRTYLGVSFRGRLFIEHNLGDSGAIAHIEEDQVAVIAPAVDPTHQDDGLAILLRGGGPYSLDAKIGREL